MIHSLVCVCSVIIFEFYHPFPLIWLLLPPSTDEPEIVCTVEDELDEMGVVKMVVGVPGLVGGITFTEGITEYDCSPLGYSIPGFTAVPPPQSVDWLIPPDEIPEVIECWSSLWRCLLWVWSWWCFKEVLLILENADWQDWRLVIEPR